VPREPCIAPGRGIHLNCVSKKNGRANGGVCGCRAFVLFVPVFFVCQRAYYISSWATQSTPPRRSAPALTQRTADTPLMLCPRRRTKEGPRSSLTTPGASLCPLEGGRSVGAGARPARPRRRCELLGVGASQQQRPRPLLPLPTSS
jgi:hypothetical protein